MVLFPIGGRSPYFPFLSERSLDDIATWISDSAAGTTSYGLLYLIGESYLFRCRDDQGRTTELAGPKGNPLQFENGITFLHFEMALDYANVYLLSKGPLKAIDGAGLLANVTRRLGVRRVFLFVRNDPWFLAEARNTLPFAFTQGYPKISLEEYRASQTLMCYTFEQCHLVSH